MIKYWILTVCAFCAFQLSFGKVYKVATPEEFSKAADAILPGDEIVIANGNYSGWSVTLNANGTEAKPIIVRAESAGKVVFTGEVRRAILKLTGSYIQLKGLKFEGCQLLKTKGEEVVLIQMNAAKYCRLTNCVFTKNTVDAQFMPIVVISGNGEHNRVDNCRFSNNFNNQELQVKVTATEVSLYTLIDHNTFMDKDSVTWKGNNGGECVQVGQDPILLGNRYSYATVRDNRFIHCNGEPEVISNKSSGNKYINNYFENCHGELVMRGGHECLIDSNTFAGGTGGIRVNGTMHTITNNSFKDLPIAIRLMYGMAKGKIDTGFYIAASDCVIKNNLIKNCSTGILIGGSKNADWTGKFDTKRYPSRTMQDVAPFNNEVENNRISNTPVPVLNETAP
jgi:poly(beta-D-mannuronate) lyase